MKRSPLLFSACLLPLLCGCMVKFPEFPATACANAVQNNGCADEIMPQNTNANGAMAKGKHFAAPQGRQMAFTAQMTLSVGDVREVISLVRALTLREGGYVRRMNNQSLVIAIPVPKAEAVLQEISKLGVVLSLQTEGEDVTRQVTDTAIRIENLQHSRKRLLALLEQAGKVDEMVKVEREITRVTTELEQLQSAQKTLQNRVQFVTMTIQFRAAAQQPAPKSDAPIVWVNQLGADLLRLNVTADVEDDSDFLFDLELPAGFIKNGESMALSADNCVIVLQDQPNAIIATHWYGNDYAPLSFYCEMIEKALHRRFNVPVESLKCTVDGVEAMEFTVRPVVGKVKYTYRLLAVVKKDSVKLLEVRAKSDAFQKAMPEAVWTKMVDSVRF